MGVFRLLLRDCIAGQRVVERTISSGLPIAYVPYPGRSTGFVPLRLSGGSVGWFEAHKSLHGFRVER